MMSRLPVKTGLRRTLPSIVIFSYLTKMSIVNKKVDGKEESGWDRIVAVNLLRIYAILSLP